MPAIGENKLKILLISPPPRAPDSNAFPVPPLGLAYVAACLEREGYAPKILDANALQSTWEGFEKEVSGEQWDVIGITGMTPVFDRTIKAAGICRKHCKHLFVGGPHASSNPKMVFEQIPGLEVAIIGEGEITAVELVKALENGQTDLSQIDGISWKKGTEIIVNKPRAIIKDLDSLPFPARHLLPNEKYRYFLSKNEVVTTMMTSRGCPYRCIFCDKTVFGQGYRSMSAKRILEEMDEIANKYKIKSVIIFDDLFTVDKNRVREVCNGIIEKKYGFEWKCEGRVNLVDEEALKLMKKANCSLVAYGVESGNQETLNFLNKNTTVQQIRDAFKKTRAAGIKSLAYVILGVPTETWEDSVRTIDFVLEIDPDFVQFSILSPTPGTKLYDLALENEWYHEIDAGMNPIDQGLKRPVAMSKNWTPEKFEKIIELSHKKFYLRPAYAFRRVIEASSPTELKNLFVMGIKYLKWFMK